jgi:hypothetical protein
MPITKRGWEILIKRTRQEKRRGQPFARTVSTYQVFHDGKEADGLSGQFVERQGPGDNAASGRANHCRIKAGRYDLSTHSGDKDKKKNIVKYKTIGYAKSGDIGALPRPSIRFLDTGEREGILMHPGNGYIWSIGCFNPGRELKAASDNLKFSLSREMILAIINDLQSFLGNKFPKKNNETIPGAAAVIEGEPT